MSMWNVICTFLTVTAVLVVTGAGDAHANAARGRRLAEQWCSQCHGVRSNQASISGVPTFREIAAERSATETSLRVFLRTSHPTMPNIVLAPDDMNDIIDYLLLLKRRK